MEQEDFKRNPPIDLVEQFYKENVDMKAILSARKSKKEVTSGLEPYTGEFGTAQKKHLLNRTMVGMAKRHMDDLDELSLDQAIELIFTPEELGEPVNNYFFRKNNTEWKKIYGRNDVPPGAPYINNDCIATSNGDDENSDGERMASFNSWINQSLYDQRTSIHWKMFFFMHNLIPTSDNAGLQNKGRFGYCKLIFEASFGDYRKAIRDITTYPDMLIYLNLGKSIKETPDENYARELQELFTVGKRPFSKYTEEDVRGIARALVGWRVDFESRFTSGPVESYFEPHNHDTGNKQFSSFYNNIVIEGKDGEDGKKELDEVIEMIFNTEESAIFLSRRLYQFFVYHDINESTEEKIIKPMAVILRENNFSLIEPLKVLLSSEHFFDSSFFNSMIKSPYDFIFSMIKEFDLFDGEIRNYPEEEKNINYSPPEYLTNKLGLSYEFFGNNLEWQLYKLGMQFRQPPSVSGWSAYYQAPVYDLFWINSMTINNRIQISNNIVNHGFSLGSGFFLSFDKIKYLLSYNNPNDLDKLIQQISVRLLGSEIPISASNRIKQDILNQKNDSYWTIVVDDFINNPTNENMNNLEWRIQTLLKLVFNLGEINLF